MAIMRCFVSGIVQGVFFRAWTRDEAMRLGLRGWVRNLPDGRVEVLAQGGPEQLAVLRDQLAQGSPPSRVAGLACAFEEDGEPLEGFAIRR